MENHLGLRYTTHLINCHLHHKCFNAACNYTANLVFLITQHERIKTQRIKQGTKNDGKRKDVRRRQTKQWLIMINQLSENR